MQESTPISAAVRPAIGNFAIVVDPQDNVAVAKREIPAGTGLRLAEHDDIEVSDTVRPGHRFAIRPIPAGAYVLQYGQPIGTSRGIALGEPVTLQNMSNEVPIVRDVPEDLHTPAPEYFPASEIPSFMGFRRPDGRVGTRNFILIVPTSMCASHEAQQISMMAEFELYNRKLFPNVDGVVAIPHNKGCGCQDGSNIQIMLRTLANYAAHPNVGGVVLMDLGCEKTNMPVVERYLMQSTGKLTKPVVKIGIQDVGGTSNAVYQGLQAVKEMLPEVNRNERVEVPMSELVLGVKCGGSDGLSGLSANPSLGCASDLLVRSGGTVLITEVPEFCGAEHILANRAKDAATARAVYEMVDWYKDYAASAGAVLNENPSPGNVAGGLLNITIKSLGAIAKAGHTRVEGVTGYAEPPRGRGLQLMQGPGYDQESTPGLVAAGATVVVFTTGRGTTIGNAIAPVIKLASNHAVYERMSSDIDLSAGSVIEGTETAEQVGQHVFEHIRRVASGEIQAKAEVHKHREFQIWAERAIAL
ncbi:MAG: UxaA family hydrolase [Acidobacteriaceae bacterium]